MSQRLRFGIFLAPFHKPGINPTLALQSDLELIQWLDRCGYDEAWLGEHHSAGTELSASPEIMIATAAERTRNIKLGTGVVSVSYHNPLWVAERIVLLDHLSRSAARRSQKDRTTWQRIAKIASDYLPQPTTLHPWPQMRFAVTHPRWEPRAGIPLARFCAGGGR